MTRLTRFKTIFAGGLILCILVIFGYHWFNRPPTSEQVELIQYLSENKTLSSQILEDMRKIHDPKHKDIKNLYDIAQKKINAFIDSLAFKASLGDNNISQLKPALQKADNAIENLKNYLSLKESGGNPKLERYSFEASIDNKMYIMSADVVGKLFQEIPQLLRDEPRRKKISEELKQYKWELSPS